VTPRLNWTVSAGKITGGQGTSEVSVDAEGNNSITVTVEVSGYASNCPNKAAYTTFLDPSLNLLSSIIAYFLTAQSTHCNCFLNADSILDTGSII
jgi:hypothetical protein